MYAALWSWAIKGLDDLLWFIFCMLLLLLEVVVGVDGDVDAGTEAPSLNMSAVPKSDPDDILRDTAERAAFCGFENEISNYHMRFKGSFKR